MTYEIIYTMLIISYPHTKHVNIPKYYSYHQSYYFNQN